MNTSLSAKQIEDQINGDIQACHTLLDLLDKEQSALQSRDADALADIIEQKSQPLNQLEESAKARARWANTTDWQASSQKWQEMLSSLQQSSLQKNWETLKNLTKQCQQQNEVNGKILTRNQQIYGRLLEIMRGQSAAPNLYTAKGAAMSNQRSFRVDQA